MDVPEFYLLLFGFVVFLGFSGFVGWLTYRFIKEDWKRDSDHK